MYIHPSYLLTQRASSYTAVVLLFLQRKRYMQLLYSFVDVFVFSHTWYAAFNFLYLVIPVVVVCLAAMVIILAIVSLLIYIKHRITRKRNAQHVYDCVNHHSSPPQPPPPRIATHNNPAYVQVELTECVAYTSTHNPSSQNWQILKLIIIFWKNWHALRL